MSFNRLLATSALTLAALLGTSSAAAADLPPRAELYLSIATPVPDSTEVVFSTQVTLTCGPTGGTHSNALRACVDLMLAGGDFDMLRDDSQLCTMEYDPVIATAEGRWRDKVVAWQRVFGNPCGLEAATGAVFRL